MVSRNVDIKMAHSSHHPSRAFLLKLVNLPEDLRLGFVQHFFVVGTGQNNQLSAVEVHADFVTVQLLQSHFQAQLHLETSARLVQPLSHGKRQTLFTSIEKHASISNFSS
jgi:hypothetical protein